MQGAAEDSFSYGWNRFKAKPGDLLVPILLVLVVGAILCLVGLLVAAPVVLIAAAFTFRVLNGRQVVADS